MDPRVCQSDPLAAASRSLRVCARSPNTQDIVGDDVFHVVLESLRGAVVKLKYSPELGAMSISRPLVLGVTYICDSGFVPSTKGPDGDPIDATIPRAQMERHPAALVRAAGGQARNGGSQAGLEPATFGVFSACEETLRFTTVSMLIRWRPSPVAYPPWSD
jgi:hypothetical protein